MSSILNDVKQTIGVHTEDKDFDVDILIAINTAIFTLTQLGIGTPSGFAVEDESEQWSDFVIGRTDLAAVKSYVHVSVRLLFDRPETGPAIQALERIRDEYTWRLEVQQRQVADAPTV